MKILCERQSFVYGCLLSNGFNHKFPSRRKEILELIRTPEFKERVHTVTDNLKTRYGDFTNTNLASFLGVKINILEKNVLTSVGTGTYKRFFLIIKNYQHINLLSLVVFEE